jgi:ribosomal protein S1
LAEQIPERRGLHPSHPAGFSIQGLAAEKQRLPVEFTQEQWDAMMARYPPGTPVSGIVASCAVFGVFVRIDELPEVLALLEIIHFGVIETDPEHRIEFPADYPPVGVRVEARILGWSLRPKDVRLTQLSHLDWNNRRRLASRDV